MIVKNGEACGKCDSCSDKAATLSALCRGATGRVCEVMWFCTDCVPSAEHLSADEVRDDVVKHFGAGAYADF